MQNDHGKRDTISKIAYYYSRDRFASIYVSEMLSFRRPSMNFWGQNIEHNQVNTQNLTFARMNEAVNATNYMFSSFFYKNGNVKNH